ncbi:hypothetical protein [Nitrosopumilus ureiphilus]|uniref:Uncharacterized protein n=1 Tax=Nitrosopumilus ureiphilus TaxID=1470067 RepID=A0A7D5R593_9ARCH|nr:hypothetical protein [Nitrosopumilus ureiphilus]QLH06017.1 hypothetical protein C5F50_02185 [Nitrosopumilus ureiphilus]
MSFSLMPNFPRKFFTIDFNDSWEQFEYLSNANYVGYRAIPSTSDEPRDAPSIEIRDSESASTSETICFRDDVMVLVIGKTLWYDKKTVIDCPES